MTTKKIANTAVTKKKIASPGAYTPWKVIACVPCLLSVSKVGPVIQVEAKLFAVDRFQEGLIARIGEYTDRREALEAAGLRE